MDIGEPRRTYTVEPIEDPVPAERPSEPEEAPAVTPSPEQPELVPAE